jgi:hypothetical protein
MTVKLVSFTFKGEYTPAHRPMEYAILHTSLNFLHSIPQALLVKYVPA